MRKSTLILLLVAGSLICSAQPASSLITDYKHLVRSNETRFKTDMQVTDTTFFNMIDILSKYCTDPKFNQNEQVQNLQGLVRFLNKVKDKEQIRSGKCSNLLLFYFSIIDWRKEGNFYDNLNSFSSFAMKCASFFSEDSTGIRFIFRQAETNPDEIMKCADQLTDNPRYRTVIEDAIVADPDFAKRYFYADNAVSYYASHSKRKDVQEIYNLFDKYGTRTKAFILYDDVERNLITPEQADSVSKDSRAMISRMVRTLGRPNPPGIRSILNEMDYRAIDWMRQSTHLAQTAAVTQFNSFSTEEKLCILVFGYRESNQQLFNSYLSHLEKSNLSAISPDLIDNLANGPMPSFLRSLDRNEKLSGFLAYFSDPNKEKLSQMLASDENDDGQPLSLESIRKRGLTDTNPPEAAATPSAVPAATVPEPGATAPSVTSTTPVASHDDAPASAVTISKPASAPAPVVAAAKPAAPKPDIARTAAAPTPAPKPVTIRHAPVVSESYDDLIVEPVHMQLSDSSKGILALKRNIYMALQDISSFIHKPYARDLLLYAAAVEPDEVFKKVDMFKGKYWCKDILEEATLNAPLYAKRYFNNERHPVTTILSYSSDSIIRKFLELSREAKYQTRPFLLFDEMVSNCITLDDATMICQDNNALFKELMSIAAQKNYIGRFNVEKEMNYYALKYIRGINDKADLPEAERYASVENLNCDELYYLMVYGREEVFDKTFQGLFSRFQSRCSTSGYWDARRFVTLPHYRSFLAMCAAYNKLDKFLSLFSSGDQNILLTTFASSLDKERDELSDAATVAETVANTSNGVVLQVLQNTLKASYLNLEMSHDYNGMAIYGILCAMFKDKAVTDKKWFAIMAKKYKVGGLTTLPNAVLMDKKIFVERMYFYNDEDGRDSYRNFITTYSSAPNWKVEQFYSYVKVSSSSGNKIEIYANKADLEESGEKEISKIIRDNNYTVKAIVHRGHSFHADATLAQIPSSARFIFIGSCGGFYKINIALRKAPDANIIATRQVGVKELNDPMIYSFNEYVRLGKDLNWKLFWDDMKEKLGGNSLFYDYVPPHKNLESLFVRAYYQIMGNE